MVVEVAMGLHFFLSHNPHHHRSPSINKLLYSTLSTSQKWLEAEEETQSSLSLSADPSLSLTSIAEKIQELDREMKYIVNKAKMAKAKAEREAAEAKVKAEKEAAAKKKKEEEERKQKRKL